MKDYTGGFMWVLYLFYLFYSSFMLALGKFFCQATALLFSGEKIHKEKKHPSGGIKILLEISVHIISFHVV